MASICKTVHTDWEYRPASGRQACGPVIQRWYLHRDGAITRRRMGMCRVAELLRERLREGGIRRESLCWILQPGIVVLACRAVPPSAAGAVMPVELIDPDARAATDCRYRR